jgi:hypothetical protein
MEMTRRVRAPREAMALMLWATLVTALALAFASVGVLTGR